MKFDPLPAEAETKQEADLPSQLTHEQEQLSRADMPQRIADLLANTEADFERLSKALMAQPILADLYNLDDEERLCSNQLGINAIFRNIGTLIAFAKEADTTSSQRGILGEWIQSAAISFSIGFTFGRCTQIHFHHSTLHLCRGLVNLIEAIKPDCDDEHVDFFNGIIHSLREKFINACLHAGHYELMLHWIPYFETVPCPFYSNNAYEFYYLRALTQQHYCLLAEMMGELASAKVYAHQAKIHMHQAVSNFIANQLSMRAEASEKSEALSSESLQCFIEATSKFLKIITQSQFTAGTIARECNNFVDASEFFSLYHELIKPDTYNKMIVRINQALGTKVTLFTSQQTYYTQLSTTSNVIIRWCIIRNYLLIKRWLSSHLPNNAILTERNETLILTLNKSASAKKISASLNAHHVTHENNENNLVFSDLTTLRLDDLVKALTPFLPKPYVHISFIKSDQANYAVLALPLPLVASNDMNITTKEQLRFRRLKKLYYEFSNAFSEQNFRLLENHLN